MGKRGISVFLMCILLFGCSRYQPIVEEVAEGRDVIEIVRLENGHYQMLVNQQPYVIKGACYTPVPIGKSHLFNYMCDPNKPWITDGKLMEEMGINTIRLYTPGDELDFCKSMIEDLYYIYGIRTILGHDLGFWNYPLANYTDADFIEEVTEDVLNVVEHFKDTPGLLMWNLGNENNYSFDGRLNPWSSPEIDALESFGERRDTRARIYYSFVNDIAKKIKEIDPYHPAALSNGETVGLEIAADYCPDIDLIGCIVYRGKVFGSFFKEVQRKFDIAVALMEFGCDAYNAFKEKEDQNSQAKFLKSQWLDIDNNLAGSEGIGNCLGGVIFEWTDEWWKTSDSDRDSWLVHDTIATWGMGAYSFDAEAGKNMNEEWFGIVALSSELENGLNKRMPRKAYYILKELWKTE